jgi:hypothetical protein
MYAPQPGYSPRPQPIYAPQRPSSNAAVIAVGIVLALAIVVGAGGLGILVNRYRTSATHAQTTPSPQTSATSGTVVFEDDFSDPSSGWSTTTLASGTTLAYSGGHYVIVAKGSLHHFSNAPYFSALPQLGMSVTATQSAGAPDDSGFGVTCAQGTGTQEVRYQFLVVVGGLYLIERSTGADSATNAPTVIKQGTAPAEPGAQSLTVAGDCITAADSQSSRLVLFINQTKAADVTDTATASGGGWVGGIDTASIDPTPSTVTITRFEERDLRGT